MNLAEQGIRTIITGDSDLVRIIARTGVRRRWKCMHNRSSGEGGVQSAGVNESTVSLVLLTPALEAISD
jgi:hypothetical protein